MIKDNFPVDMGFCESSHLAQVTPCMFFPSIPHQDIFRFIWRGSITINFVTSWWSESLMKALFLSWQKKSMAFLKTVVMAFARMKNPEFNKSYWKIPLLDWGLLSFDWKFFSIRMWKIAISNRILFALIEKAGYAHLERKKKLLVLLISCTLTKPDSYYPDLSLP